MKDKIFKIIFFIFFCKVCAGMPSISNPINNIIKSPIFLMIIPLILSAIISLFVEPPILGVMSINLSISVMIYVNLLIICKYIIEKENQTVGLMILFTLSVIFCVILIFNIACSFAKGKDKNTDDLIEISYCIMRLLFILEISFILCYYFIYAKITSKDKVIANKVEQNTLPMTNESVKTETKPIEDSVIKHNKNVGQAVTERDLTHNIVDMQMKMEYYPLKKDILYQIVKIEPKMIDVNEISSELRNRLNNNDDDLDLAEIEMNYAYTCLEETKQKLIKLEKEKYELENSKHRILKDPRGIFYKNILQSIKNNKSFLIDYESHFEAAKFKYASLKWEQSSTENENSDK